MESADYLRFAPDDARGLVGVSRATWSRWRAGKSRIPVATVNLLRTLRGDLAYLGDDWKGWKFHGGKLFDAAGTAHTPGDILAWHWTRQELQTARSSETITAELYRRLGV